MTEQGGRNPRWRGIVGNGLLTLFSLAVVMGGILALDRLLGHFWPELPPERAAILFPPDSTHAFESLEYAYTIHTNSLGLRDYPLDLDDATSYRVAVIGDSFTYGWGVDIEDVWVKQVERNLRDAGFAVTLVNMGRPGAGSVSYAELAKEALHIIKPDLVVIALLHNDMAYEGADRRPPKVNYVRHYAEEYLANLVRAVRHLWGNDTTVMFWPSQSVSAEEHRRLLAESAINILQTLDSGDRARFDALEPSIQEAFMEGRLNPFMVMSGIRAPGLFVSVSSADERTVQEMSQRVSRYLRVVRHAAERIGASCLAVIIPTGPYVNEHQYRHVQRLGFQVEERMLTSDIPDRIELFACEQAGIPCHSVTEAFRTHRDREDLYFPLDGHFAPAGHRLYADLITPVIQAAIADKAPRRTAGQS